MKQDTFQNLTSLQITILFPYHQLVAKNQVQNVTPVLHIEQQSSTTYLLKRFRDHKYQTNKDKDV